MKPGADNRLHALSHDQLKNRHAALGAVEMRRPHLGDDVGRFSRTQLGNRFRIRTILVAKWQVVQKIFDGADPLLVKNGSNARSYPFVVMDRGVEFEHGVGSNNLTTETWRTQRRTQVTDGQPASGDSESEDSAHDANGLR